MKKETLHKVVVPIIVALIGLAGVIYASRPKEYCYDDIVTAGQQPPTVIHHCERER